MANVRHKDTLHELWEQMVEIEDARLFLYKSPIKQQNEWPCVVEGFHAMRMYLFI